MSASASAPIPLARASVAQRACLAAGFAINAAWFFIYNQAQPALLVDEPGHVGNILHFLDGKPGWPPPMTMLPGYHYLVVALWQLHPPCGIVTLARFVALACACLGIASFAVAWRRLHRPGAPLAAAGPATLLFALLPLLQPFTGMAYTDAPALAFVLLAVALQLEGSFALAALAFIPALATRQTNVLWPALLVAWEFLRNDAPRREFFRRTGWLLGLLVLCAIAIVAALKLAGRLTPGTETGNDLHFNPATLHTTGLLVLLLGLPIWLTGLPAAARASVAALRARPVVASLMALIAVGAAIAIGLTFRNPHQWNRDLWWDGCSFTLLRNWPLVWLDRHPAWQIVSGFNVVLMVAALAVVIARQSHRRFLLLALALGLLQPFTNSLVEPRYFIPAAALFLLGLNLDATTTKRLGPWWALLCALHAPFIVKALSLW